MKIFFLIFAVVQVIYTQTPPYYHYSSSNGLSSSTSYDVIQDKKGYIWIATNNGLSRFDGKNFVNYGIKEGLNSTTIVSLAKGDNGEIYIGNMEKGINVFMNDELSSYTSPNTKIYRIGDIFFENNKLYAHSIDGSFNIYKEGMSNVSCVLNYAFNNKIVVTNKIRRLSDGSFWALTTIGIFRIENDRLNKVEIEGIDKEELYNLCEDASGNIYASGQGVIYVINNYKVIKTIRTENAEDKIYALFIDSKNNLWFSVLNNGFRVIYANSDNIFDLSSKLKLQKGAINRFIEDKENNIWISTFGKGVFCLNNLYLNNFNEDDGLSNNNVQAFEKDINGRLIIGTYNGINILKDGKFQHIKIGKTITDYVYEMQFLKNSIYVCSSFRELNSFPQKDIYGNKFIFISNPSFCFTKDSTYFLGAWGNNYFESKSLSNIYDNQYTLIESKLINNRVNKIFEDSENNLWFGTTLGLCKMTNGVKTFFPDNSVLSSSINSIIEDNNNKIWYACEKGIANYDLKTDGITIISDLQGYDLTASKSIAFDSKNRMWIGNTKGLYLLDDNTLKYFNTQNGLQSNEILTLFYDKEKNLLWVGTSNGFCSFDINSYDKQKPHQLNIIIDYIKSGDSLFKNSNDLIFEPENNEVFIKFSAPSFSSPSSTVYQYSLNNQWENTQSDFIEFASLEHGVYNIAIKAKTENNPWSESAFISFVIKPKFTETIWFQLFLASIFAGSVLFFSLYRIKYVKRKNREKIQLTNHINELKHRAVSALMNPHFIFNALSSVQYLVNMQKKREANDYISLMAKLFRKNLDLATEDFISLHEEIDRLNLYLEIEKLRFGDKLSYSFSIGENIKPVNIELPNMIIQPFIENSVIHGILEKDGAGFIKIVFDFEDIEINNSKIRCFVIRIIDNGIGVSTAKKKNGHTSKAISIIKERLTLLSQELEIPNPIVISDLSERTPGSSGTEVVLTLPPPLYRITLR